LFRLPKSREILTPPLQHVKNYRVGRLHRLRRVYGFDVFDVSRQESPIENRWLV